MLVYMNRGRCPLCIFCSRSTPPKEVPRVYQLANLTYKSRVDLLINLTCKLRGVQVKLSTWEGPRNLVELLVVGGRQSACGFRVSGFGFRVSGFGFQVLKV